MRGQKRGSNKLHDIRTGIPPEKEKQKLMTTKMLCIMKSKRKQSEERCIMRGPPAV